MPKQAQRLLDETRLTQPALFVIEYALAKLWQSWGVEPSAMFGHSIGEFTAACVAGVFSLQSALEIVAERGRLMQTVPVGAMAAVTLPEHEVRPLLDADLCLAGVNSQRQCVVSGPQTSIDNLQAVLAARGVMQSTPAGISCLSFQHDGLDPAAIHRLFAQVRVQSAAHSIHFQPLGELGSRPRKRPIPLLGRPVARHGSLSGRNDRAV